MKSDIYPLVLGNIAGVRGISNHYLHWHYVPEQVKEIAEEIETVAVMTGSQAEKQNKISYSIESSI